LLKLLNFGAGSDSTAGLATHELQQANTQSTVRVLTSMESVRTESASRGRRSRGN
jgi:hypothetical protein